MLSHKQLLRMRRKAIKRYRIAPPERLTPIVVKGPVEWSMEAATQHVLATVPRWRKPSEVTEPGLYIIQDCYGKQRQYLYESTTEHNVGKMFTSSVFYGPIPTYKEG